MCIYWLLAADYWLLAAGCWLLAAGCWLLKHFRLRNSATVITEYMI